MSINPNSRSSSESAYTDPASKNANNSKTKGEPGINKVDKKTSDVASEKLPLSSKDSLPTVSSADDSSRFSRISRLNDSSNNIQIQGKQTAKEDVAKKFTSNPEDLINDPDYRYNAGDEIDSDFLSSSTPDQPDQFVFNAGDEIDSDFLSSNNPDQFVYNAGDEIDFDFYSDAPSSNLEITDWFEHDLKVSNLLQTLTEVLKELEGKYNTPLSLKEGSMPTDKEIETVEQLVRSISDLVKAQESGSQQDSDKIILENIRELYRNFREMTLRGGLNIPIPKQKTDDNTQP